uniref:Uncharacterized protein n=1 Tax=Oryza barthii TaxID=65489 RepID=A0A0D3EXI8_9ORYZ
MRLAQLLVACAEAVAPRQRCRPARRAFQRVASFFVQELLDRRASTGAGPCEHGVLHPAVVVREARRRARRGAPYLWFAHFLANACTLQAFEGESNDHVVDLGWV